MFSAYDPVEWNLQIEPGAVIAGILVFGYHNQIVNNVPPGTQVAFSTFIGGQGWDCPKSEYFNDSEEFYQLGQMLDQEFGHRIDENHVGVPDNRALGMARNTGPTPVSLWERLIGSKVATAATGGVRTSGQLAGR